MGNNEIPKNGITRLTPARNAICYFFESHNEPADYNQISAYLLECGISVNKTTIYRQLDFLLHEKYIRELDFGEGKKRYERERSHHHHLLCTNCHKLECIELNDNFQQEEQLILKERNFKVHSHTLEFFGICGDCQEVAI